MISVIKSIALWKEDGKKKYASLMLVNNNANNIALMLVNNNANNIALMLVNNNANNKADNNGK